MGHQFAITLAIPSPAGTKLDLPESMAAIEIAKTFLESQGHEVEVDLERSGEYEYVLWIGVERNNHHWPKSNRKLYISKDGAPQVWQCYHHQFFLLSQMQTVIEEILTTDLAHLDFELERSQ